MSSYVREMVESDVVAVVDYFVSLPLDTLKGMGVQPDKLPKRDEWIALLQDDLKKPIPEKSFFYVIWMYEDKAVGHCNINKIQYGKEAFMHLHIWEAKGRRKGMGSQFVKMSVPYFFNTLELQYLYCEPYALNEGASKTLIRSGFDFVKQYETLPGWINYYQPVRRHKMSREKMELITVD